MSGYYDIDDHMADLYEATHNGQTIQEGLAAGNIDAIQFRDVTVDINKHIVDSIESELDDYDCDYGD